jgi:hypothetical protein
VDELKSPHNLENLNEETMNAKTEVAVNSAVVDKAVELVALGPDAKLADVIRVVNELIKVATTKRDRGPDSTRTMVEADAKRIMLGDLKDVSHTKAAEALGLSYGQVYSARKGFTFKAIYQEMVKAAKK